MAQAYDTDVQPSPQEAEDLVKRLSSGFSLSENTTQSLTPMDDKSLKIATFSLQRYLKVKKKALKKNKRHKVNDIRKKTLQPSFWKEEV